MRSGALVAAMIPATAAAAAGDCQAVHVFIARGSQESYPGVQAPIAQAICAGVASCDVEDVQYPATLENYCSSAAAGVSGGQAQITAYAQRCPSARLVLTGWSQGAHVVGDILGGGGGTFASNPCTQPANAGLARGSPPGSQIAAVLLFGDVRHAAGQSYNVGTAPNGQGAWPRTGGSLGQYAGVLRSYCDSGDPACDAANASKSRPTHGAYFTKYKSEAVAWVLSKLA